MQDLGITEAEYDQLANAAPMRRTRPIVTGAAKAQTDMSDAEGEEEVDQLDDDDPVPPSPRISVAPTSVLPVRSTRASRLSRISHKPYAIAVDSRTPSGRRSHRAEPLRTRSEFESAASSTGFFSRDDRKKFLKELMTVQLALTMAQEKLAALLPNDDISDEPLGVEEGSSRNTSNINSSISAHRVDVGTSPMRGPNVESPARALSTDITRESPPPGTSAGFEHGKECFRKPTDVHVSENRKIEALINHPNNAEDHTHTHTLTSLDELPAVFALNADNNEEDP